MDQANFWLMSIIGPAVLLIVLIWLVMRSRTNNAADKRRDGTAERGASEVYRKEEIRRREGTDDL
ncbi:MAG TPA: hypothetical protein VIL42_04590 [Sphingomicrobium sp.]|jgi:uncharacterized membrane protein